MTRLALLVGIYMGACAVGGALVIERALHRPRTPLTPDDTRHAKQMAASLGAQVADASITAGDGAILQGWLVTPEHQTGHSVLLLHGIVSNRAAMLSAARPFVEEGYRALLVDLRASGESGGELSLFGAQEADDTRRWIAWLGRQAGTECIYLFGQSLGAAFAVQAADASGVCAAVADSGFASFRDVAFDRISQQLHMGRWLGQTLLRPGVELGFLYAWARYGVNLNDASAVDAAAGSGSPIFVIHGLEDGNSPPRNAELLRRANPARVTIWLVPGAGHGLARRVTGEAYQRRVMNFLASHRQPFR